MSDKRRFAVPRFSAARMAVFVFTSLSTRRTSACRAADSAALFAGVMTALMDLLPLAQLYAFNRNWFLSR